MLDFESRYESDLSTMMDMHEVMLHQLATYAYNAQAYDILYRTLVGNRAYFDATFRQSGMLGTYDEAVGLALNTFQEPMTEQHLIIWHMLKAAQLVVRDLADQFTDEQLVQLTLAGRLEEAVSHAQLRVGSSKRVTGMMLILQTLLEHGYDASSVIHLTKDLIEHGLAGANKANAYFDLGQLVTKQYQEASIDLFSQAVTTARKLNPPTDRVTILIRFLATGYIALDSVYADIEATCQQTDAKTSLAFADYLHRQNDARSLPFARLAIKKAPKPVPYQPTNDLFKTWGEIIRLCYVLDLPERDTVFAAAQGVWGKYDTEILKIARYFLHEGKEQLALTLARHIHEPHHNREIVTHFAEKGRYEEALEIAHQIEDPWTRNLSLHRIIVHMWSKGGNDLQPLLREMLTNIQQADLGLYSVNMGPDFLAVATMIELSLQQGAFSDAIQLVDLIRDEIERNIIFECQIAPAMALSGHDMEALTLAQKHRVDQSMRQEFEKQRRELITHIQQQLSNLPVHLEPQKEGFLQLIESLNTWELEDLPAFVAMAEDMEGLNEAIIQNDLERYLAQIRQETPTQSDATAYNPLTSTSQMMKLFFTYHLGTISLEEPIQNQEFSVERAFTSLANRCHFLATCARLDAIQIAQRDDWTAPAIARLLHAHSLTPSDAPLLYDQVKTLLRLPYAPVQNFLASVFKPTMSIRNMSTSSLDYRARTNLVYVMQKEEDPRATDAYNYLRQKSARLPQERQAEVSIHLSNHMLCSGYNQATAFLDETERLISTVPNLKKQIRYLEQLAKKTAPYLPERAVSMTDQASALREKFQEPSPARPVIKEHEYEILLEAGRLLAAAGHTPSNVFATAKIRMTSLSVDSRIKGLLKLAETNYRLGQPCDELLLEVRQIISKLPVTDDRKTYQKDYLFLQLAETWQKLERPELHQLLSDTWQAIQQIPEKTTHSIDSSPDIRRQGSGRKLMKIMFSSNHPDRFEVVKWVWSTCRTTNDVFAVYEELCSSGYRLQQLDIDSLQKYVQANTSLAKPFVDILILSECYETLLQATKELIKAKTKPKGITDKEFNDHFFALKEAPIKLAKVGQNDIAKQIYQMIYPYLFPTHLPGSLDLLKDWTKSLTVDALRPSRYKSKGRFVLNLVGLLLGFWLLPIMILSGWLIVLTVFTLHDLKPRNRILSCIQKGEYLTEMGQTVAANKQYDIILKQLRKLQNRKPRSDKEMKQNKVAIHSAIQSLLRTKRWADAEQAIKLTGYEDQQVLEKLQKEQRLLYLATLPEADIVNQWHSLPSEIQEVILPHLKQTLLKNGYYSHHVQQLDSSSLYGFLQQVVRASDTLNINDTSLGYRVLKSTSRVARWNSPYGKEIYGYL